MKTIKQLLIFALVCNVFTLFAQQKVALHSNGVTTIFGGSNPFTDAYNAASSGDTIYLPGGNLPLPVTIDKGLVIIGAGHFPDSTAVTTPTILNGSITISQNAQNLHLEGVLLDGSISFTNNHKVDNVKIKRCKFVSLVYNGNGTTACENNEISECIIADNIVLSNCKTSVISNCIIAGKITNGSNMGISNNILFYDFYPYGYAEHVTFINVDNSLISNNIIFRIYGDFFHSSCELNTFQNNIFKFVPTFGSNVFTNNYNNIDLSTFFINQSVNGFDYLQDYHLVNPALYLGNDGTQVGIYGGLYPFKGGSVPVNPHFQTKNIAPTTDNNGDLNIQIKVEAQDN